MSSPGSTITLNPEVFNQNLRSVHNHRLSDNSEKTYLMITKVPPSLTVARNQVPKARIGHLIGYSPSEGEELLHISRKREKNPVHDTKSVNVPGSTDLVVSIDCKKHHRVLNHSQITPSTVDVLQHYRAPIASARQASRLKRQYSKGGDRSNSSSPTATMKSHPKLCFPEKEAITSFPRIKKRPLSPSTPLADAKRPKTKGGFVLDSSDDSDAHSDNEGSESGLNTGDEKSVSVVPLMTSVQNGKVGTPPMPSKSLNRDRLKMLLGKKKADLIRDQHLHPTSMRQPSRTHSAETSNCGAASVQPSYASQPRTLAGSDTIQGDTLPARCAPTNHSVVTRTQGQILGSLSMAPGRASSQSRGKNKQSFETGSIFKATKLGLGSVVTSSPAATSLGKRLTSMLGTNSQAQPKKPASDTRLRTPTDEKTGTTAPHSLAAKSLLHDVSSTKETVGAAGTLGQQQRLIGVKLSERCNSALRTTESPPQKTKNENHQLPVIQSINAITKTRPFQTTLTKQLVKTSLTATQPISRFRISQPNHQNLVAVPADHELEPNLSDIGTTPSHPRSLQQRAHTILLPRESQPRSQTTGVTTLSSSLLHTAQQIPKRGVNIICGSGEDNTPVKKPDIVSGDVLPRSTPSIMNGYTKGLTGAAHPATITQLESEKSDTKVGPTVVYESTSSRAGQFLNQAARPPNITSGSISNMPSTTTLTNVTKTDTHAIGPNNSFSRDTLDMTFLATAIQSSNKPLLTPPRSLGTALEPVVSVKIWSRDIPAATAEAAEQVSASRTLTLESQQSTMNNLTTLVSAEHPRIDQQASATGTQEEPIMATPSSKSVLTDGSPLRPLSVHIDRVASSTALAALPAPCVHQTSPTIPNSTGTHPTPAPTTCHIDPASLRTFRSSETLAKATEPRIDEYGTEIEHPNTAKPKATSSANVKHHVLENDTSTAQSEHVSKASIDAVLVLDNPYSHETTMPVNRHAESLLSPSLAIIPSPRAEVDQPEAKTSLPFGPAAQVTENLRDPPAVGQDVEPYFEYTIFQKLWANTQIESDMAAAEPISRPFTNVDEANAQAESLFHTTRLQYTQYFQVLFSSTSKMRDKVDCSMLLGTFSPLDNPGKDSYLKVWVHRDYVSKFANKTPRNLGLAPFISKSVYILRLFKLISSNKDADTDTDTDEDEEEPPIREYQPLPRTEVYTTLNAANRAACSLQIEVSHEKTPKSPLTINWQNVNLRELNEKVHALDPSMGGKEGCWKSDFNGCGLGSDRFELVVEQAGLCGPRNL